MIVISLFGGATAPQRSTSPQSSVQTNDVEQVIASVPSTESTLLTRQEAEQIALDLVGLLRDDVQMDHTELDYEKGLAVWEVEFRHAYIEYDLEINARTGEVIKSQKEEKSRPVTFVPSTDLPTPPEPTPVPVTPVEPSEKELTKDEAIAIALDYAGLRLDEVKRLKVEKDREDGVYVYEIEFRFDFTEYDYTVHAASGKILKLEKEIEKPKPQPTPTPDPTPVEPVVPVEPTEKELTKDEAIAIALDHAELRLDEVKRLKVEKDRDDGIHIYEIEFQKGNVEYEYEIRVSDGKIISRDKEIDD